jgi:Mg2+ and Co2+ transporter CorA
MENLGTLFLVAFAVWKVLCGFWARKVALRKNRHDGAWFCLGFFFELFAIIVIYLIRKKQIGGTPS